MTQVIARYLRLLSIPDLMRHLAALLFLALLVAASPATAQNAERILLFDSDLTVEADGTFLVKETIRVNARGRQIRRGIFRDFPLRFIDNDGQTKRVGFNVISVTKNGAAEPYFIERDGAVARVYIGDSDVFLSPGVYSYTITYRSDRQLRRFDDNDEVYWNVTGNAWDFAIEKATATIRLPNGAQALQTTLFTGRVGSTDKNARSSLADNGNVVTFETTRALGAREGLTIAIQFPKGFVAEPSLALHLQWWLRDNLALLIAYGGLLAVGLYYTWMWVRVGRDPPAETIVPRWDLPAGVSPALAHYVENHGLKGDGFTAISAAALSLAVKGYLELENHAGTLTMKSTGQTGASGRLPVGEDKLLSRVRHKGGQLTINEANGSAVKAMATHFRMAMEREHRSVYYNANTGYVIVGVIASIATMFGAIILGQMDETAIAFAIPLLFIGTIATVIIVNMAKAARSGLGGKVQLSVFLFVIIAVIGNVGAAGFSIVRDLDLNFPLVAALATLFFVNLLFFFLMGAPTELGQKRSAEIAGLKRYLTVAEKDRMNMLGSPQMSPGHYEKLLPYAVALGVEKPWSNAFQTWLAAAIAAGAASAIAYHGPRWYNGGTFRPDNIGTTMGNLAGDLSKSMTAAMPVPQSSSSGFSGGGGGFSGGGGGGGGGGGW